MNPSLPLPFPLLAAAVLTAGSAAAVPFVRVNTLEDENDGVATGGISLRDAVAAVDPGGTVAFDSTLDGGVVRLRHGHIVLNESVTIDALSLRCGVHLDAGRASRHFDVSLSHGESVLLRGLTMTHGLATGGNGGAIRLRSQGSVNLTLVQCAAMANEATRGTIGGGLGGGLSSANGGADILIDSCTFACNRSQSHGGGISVLGGDMTVTNSTFHENRAHRPNPTVTLVSGGGIDLSGGALTLSHSTIVQNHCDFAGGGITVSGAGPHPVTHSIITDNTPINVSQTAGSVVSNGYNIVGGGASGFTHPTDLSHGTAILDALRYNLGRVPTMRPFPSSPAVDSGDPALVAGTTAPLTDPRTLGRIVDSGAAGPGAVIDRGACELQRITVVDTAVDENDGPGAGTGTSLRDAIASLTPGFGGRIAFDPALDGTDFRLTLGELDLSHALVIIDASALARGLQLFGPANPQASPFRIFDLSRSFAQFRNVHIREGFVESSLFALPEHGGGVRLGNDGFLWMTECTLRENTADSGGGLWVDGDSVCVFQQCVVESNTALGSMQGLSDNEGFGGGIAVNAGIVKMIDSTVTLNFAGSKERERHGDGGGIALLRNDSRLRLAHSTIADNHAIAAADTAAGGVSVVGGAASATHTIVAHNAPRNYLGPSGSLVSLGYNLETGTDVGFTATGDLQNTNPLLATLHDYGGRTRCLATLPGSPARDAGDPAIEPFPLVFPFCRHGDQRNASRIWPNRGRIDIGAYEGGFPVICTFWTWGVEVVGEDLEPGGDTDSDFIPDEAEYAMGLDPFGFDTAGTPDASLVAGRLRGMFRRNAWAKDVIWKATLSTDLSATTEIYRNERGTVTNSTGLIGESGSFPIFDVTVEDPAVSPAARTFMNFEVEITSE